MTNIAFATTTVFKNDPYFGGDVVLTTEVNPNHTYAEVRVIDIPTNLAEHPSGGAMQWDLQVKKELCENHEELLEELKKVEYQTEGSSVMLDIIDKKRYTLEELENIPTLSESQDADLKIEYTNTRIWLSRMTVSDGAEYDNKVEIEKQIDGSWVVVESYQAK